VFNGSRKNDNWESQQVFALDFDSGLEPTEAYNKLKDLGITPQIIYTSFSDSKELRKFRVVFVLDKAIKNKEVVGNLNIALMNVFADTNGDTKADKACKDFARLYYGGKKVLLANESVIDRLKFVEILTPYFPVTTFSDNIKKTSKKTVTQRINLADVDGSKAHKIAYTYTKNKGIDYVSGQRNHFVSTYCGLMCQFGVEFNEMMSEISKEEVFTYDSEQRAKGVYNTYAHQFGTKSTDSTLYDVDTTEAQYHLSKGQKLSSLGIDPSELKDKVLVAPTGSGKTYFVAHLNGKKVLVVPTRSLSDEVALRYNGKAFNEDSKDVSNDDDFIVVTYASYANLVNVIDIENYRVFLDEAHNFTSSSSASFMLKPLTETLESLKFNVPKAVTLLTATPLRSADPYLQSFEVVKVTSDKNINKELTIIKATDKYKLVQTIFKNSKDKGIFVACLLNNTKSLLDRYLAVLPEYNIETFSSAQKSEDHFVELIKSGDIKPETDGIFSTTVLKEGNSFNLNTRDEVAVVVLGKFSVEEIEQFAARFRDAKKVTVIVARHADFETADIQFNADFVEEVHIANAEHNVKHFNSIVIESINVQSINKVLGQLKATHTKTNELGIYEVDYLSISNAIFEQEKSVCWNNTELFYKKANKYGWEIVEEIEYKGFLTEEEEEIQKAVVNAKTADKNQKIEKLLIQIYEEGLQVNSTKAENCKDVEEGEVRYRLDYIYKYENNAHKVFKIYRDVATTTQSWNTFVKQVQNRKIETDSGLTKRDDYKLIKAVRAEFSVGEVLTKDEVLNRLQKVFGASTAYKSSENISKGKAVKFLKTLFECADKRVRLENKKQVRKIEIKSDNPLPFKVNTDDYNQMMFPHRTSTNENPYNIGLFKEPLVIVG